MGKPSRTLVVVLVLAICLTVVRGRAQQSASTSPPAEPDAQAAGPSATDTSQDDGQPVFRAGVNFVRVDAIVTDRAGRSVTDLEAKDFTVSEDGREQTIETFKRVDLNGGLMNSGDGPPRTIRNTEDEEAEAARDDVRLFGIFLDDYHVRRETSLQAREELSRFVETQLGPTDMLTLMYPLQPLSDVLFTRNHDAVRRGLSQFVGRKYDYEPMNPFEDRYANESTETVERIRNQVSLSAVKALIVRMGSLKEGRKALVLVSEGYSNYVPPQLRSYRAGAPDFRNPASGSPIAGQGSLLEERAQFVASSDLNLDLREVYAAANRHNVAIYTVDPRGLAPAEFSIDQNVGVGIDRDFLNATLDTLRGLASETDGRAIVGRNDLTLAMKQIVVDSSSYYLLGYSPDAVSEDGKFHEIKVTVRRPGVHVRARGGYWAITQDDAVKIEAAQQPGPAPDVTAALASIGVRAPSRAVWTWVGTERADNGQTRVRFVWEPARRTPGADSRFDDQPVRVVLTALGADGMPHFRAPIPASATPGGSAVVTFDAPPGPLRLRIAVENADADVLDREQQDLEVPDLSSSASLLGTPSVFRVRTVRDMQSVKADPNAAPTAAREFSRTERLLVRVPVYVGDAGGEVSARLLNRSGESMMDLVVDAPSTESRLIEVALASLPPGEYLVAIVATRNGDQKRELVGFRVTG